MRLVSVLYLELVLLVFGALVEGPVIPEPPDVVELVEALDVVGHPVPLQHVLALWNRRHSVNLQVCTCRQLSEASGRATRKTTPSPILVQNDQDDQVSEGWGRGLSVGVILGEWVVSD